MDKYEERFARQSDTWTGPKLIVLGIVVLGVALAIILTAATWVPRLAV
jgi:hypothetical protein